MKRADIIYEFLVSEKDQWGNIWFLCPLCGDSRQRDGLIKHMVVQAKKQKAYRDFLKKHQK